MGALSGLRRHASGLHRARPFITDLGNGRTEFTGGSFEQWVAKTANYLEAEFGTELQFHIQLRAHWLWPVMIAALDELESTLVPLDRADVIMRIGIDEASEIPVLALNDHPMALPFSTTMPPLQHDFFLEVRGGGDTRSAGPVHETALIDDGRRLWTAAELVAATAPLDADQRLALITGPEPLTSVDQIVAISVLPWVSGASLVIANNPLDIRGEHITHTVSFTPGEVQ